MKRILFVDDSEDARIISSSVLTAAGYEVTVAENGMHALTISRELQPDLIISDILMPEMDGFQLCRRIREDNLFQDTPFIFYTATYTDEQDEKFALSLGADAFIVKPMESTAFLEKIEKAERKQTVDSEANELPAEKTEKQFLRQYNERLIHKLEKKITDLEIETRSRKRAESYLKATMDAVPDMIFRLDKEGRFIDFKPAIDFGPFIPAEEFLGFSVLEVMPEDIGLRTMVNIQRLLGGHKVESYIYQLPKGGNVHDYEARYSLTSNNEVVVLVRDITSEYSARRSLEKSESQYRKLFENSPDAISITTVDGHILDVNSAFLEVYGYSREEALKINAVQLYTSPDERDILLNDIKEKGFIRNNESKRRRKDGSEIVCVTSAAARFDTDGNILELQCTARDVTEIKDLEKQLFQSQKMESVGHLAGGVAHDFNNMLSIIFGYGELCLERLSRNDPLYQDLEEIVIAAKRSKKLVHQLLAFAKQQPIAPRILIVNDLLETNRKMFERLIGEDIEVQIHYGKDLWPIQADPTHIDQVLTNLIINARDAIGGVGSLIISTENVVLDEAYCHTRHGLQPGDFVCITVSDTGSGMSKETLEHLFEPFYTTKEPGAGTGLGLSTVHGIVEQNNGFIFVYSELGHGTTFRIYLPGFQMESEVVTPEVPSLSASYRSKGETVLIVEDEVVILKLCCRILEKNGYTVLSAPSPGEALLLCEKHTGGIDLLITDVVMPNMNGKELAERLIHLQPEVKVIFMSGYTSQIISKRGVVAAGNKLIEKPFSSNSLLRIVRETLDDKAVG